MGGYNLLYYLQNGKSVKDTTKYWKRKLCCGVTQSLKLSPILLRIYVDYVDRGMNM